jgi:magnesium chelatase subunit D
MTFPFSSVVGQDDAKLALLLCAIDPSIGGVLLRGQKGSAKTTVARAVAALLPGEARFVELPLGATEDRVVGSVDLTEMLTAGTQRLRPGLLSDAHGGVLYVDEVNLLADHLVDVLLDVATSGINRIERDGVAHSHPARFVLVGSMNPEEGDLRPQLLDRFGLSVTVMASIEPAERADAVRRRLTHDSHGTIAADVAADQKLRERLAATRSAEVPDEVVLAASTLAVAVGAEGLRADIVLCRAAAAFAGWDGRLVATTDDLRAVAHLVLAHRRHRGPFDAPTMSSDEINDALDETLGADTPSDPLSSNTSSGPEDEQQCPDGAPSSDPEPDPGNNRSIQRPAAAALTPPSLSASTHRTSPASGRRSPMVGLRGRITGTEPVGTVVTDLAVTATAVAVATRREETGTPLLHADDIRQARRETKAGNLLIFVVDASGSMGATDRIEAAKGAVLGLLTDAYQRRDRVALISMRGERAEVVLQPTASGEIARTRLVDLPIGGTTPLADGLAVALKMATAPGNDPGRAPLLVLLTDGRATYGANSQNPLEAAQSIAAEIARRSVDAVVIDAETGMPRLGLAAELAHTMGATYLHIDDLGAARIEDVVRTHLASRTEGR